jgi:hypothetical protein
MLHFTDILLLTEQPKNTYVSVSYSNNICLYALHFPDRSKNPNSLPANEKQELLQGEINFSVKWTTLIKLMARFKRRGAVKCFLLSPTLLYKLIIK